jgi:hypothetical protein
MSLLVERLSKSYNTTSSALSVLAFEAYARKVEAESIGGINVRQFIGSKATLLQLTGELFPMAPFDPETASIKIDNKTPTVAYYALTQAGFDSRPSTEKQISGIEIFREYVNKDDEAVQKVGIGEELTVKLKARVTVGDYAPNVVIVDLLPGGFEVVLDSIDRRPGYIEYTDAREDRVLVFGDLGKETREYEYRIKAVNRGTYEVPPVYTESMYDRRLRSKGKTEKIIVE